MIKLRENIEKNLPFITVINYGDEEFVGIVVNQDQWVTTFFDIESLRTEEEKTKMLELGEVWWWESNRSVPINIFLRKEIEPFKYSIKTFNSKDVKIILGPVVNLNSLNLKRVKRKSVQLVRKR